MKLHTLNEQTEPQAPEGKVLIGQYDTWGDIKYADYKKNLRDSVGPLGDIRSAKNVTININNKFTLFTVTAWSLFSGQTQGMGFHQTRERYAVC